MSARVHVAYQIKQLSHIGQPLIENLIRAPKGHNLEAAMRVAEETRGCRLPAVHPSHPPESGESYWLPCK